MAGIRAVGTASLFTTALNKVTSQRGQKKIYFDTPYTANQHARSTYEDIGILLLHAKNKTWSTKAVMVFIVMSNWGHICLGFQSYGYKAAAEPLGSYLIRWNHENAADTVLLRTTCGYKRINVFSHERDRSREGHLQALRRHHGHRHEKIKLYQYGGIHVVHMCSRT